MFANHEDKRFFDGFIIGGLAVAFVLGGLTIGFTQENFFHPLAIKKQDLTPVFAHSLPVPENDPQAPRNARMGDNEVNQTVLLDEKEYLVAWSLASRSADVEVKLLINKNKENQAFLGAQASNPAQRGCVDGKDTYLGDNPGNPGGSALLSIWVRNGQQLQYSDSQAFARLKGAGNACRQVKEILADGRIVIETSELSAGQGIQQSFIYDPKDSSSVLALQQVQTIVKGPDQTTVYEWSSGDHQSSLAQFKQASFVSPIYKIGDTKAFNAKLGDQDAPTLFSDKTLVFQTNQLLHADIASPDALELFEKGLVVSIDGQSQLITW